MRTKRKDKIQSVSLRLFQTRLFYSASCIRKPAPLPTVMDLNILLNNSFAIFILIINLRRFFLSINVKRHSFEPGFVLQTTYPFNGVFSKVNFYSQWMFSYCFYRKTRERMPQYDKTDVFLRKRMPFSILHQKGSIKNAAGLMKEKKSSCWFFHCGLLKPFLSGLRYSEQILLLAADIIRAVNLIFTYTN